ncbi:MAG TPA: hypothetical protein VIH45_13200 [Desulfuromonadaceae bacterium]
MKKSYVQFALSLLLVAAVARPAAAADAGAGQGEIVTLWPLFDYRSSPATGYSNLSILGPLFKREQTVEGTTTAIRPLFSTRTTHDAEESNYLYPIASTGSSGEGSYTQVLELFQTHVNRPGTPEETHDAMLFPFYISGTSEKYGPYTSVFPLYGDIYERFWRDEYHYVLFPLYGRTVSKGTTSTNYLYPLFNTVSGDRESGFAFWPLYGQSAKEGVYEKRFALWPLYFNESLAKDSDNPVERRYLLPFYASSQSPKRSSTYAPWPFCGVVRDETGQAVERDFFWPFWMTAHEKDTHTDRFLPFYAESQGKISHSRWVLWPVYHQETLDSPEFRQDKTSLFYFLFHRSDESWPKIGRERARSAFWPLYAWKRDEEGVRTLSLPAPVEPVIWNEGVERNWAPLWRIFIATWDDKGDGATSILWNLYWRERRGAENAWELAPLVSWRSTRQGTDFRLLKGLLGYASEPGRTSLRFLWIPFSWRSE